MLDAASIAEEKTNDVFANIKLPLLHHHNILHRTVADQHHVLENNISGMKHNISAVK